MKWGLLFDIATQEAKIAELEYKISEPGFWDEPDKAQVVMQELNGFKDSVNKYSMINDKYEDMNILWQMGMEDQDESVYAEVSDNLKELTQLIESLELDLMLSGEYDANSAILTLHAGAGGQLYYTLWVCEVACRAWYFTWQPYI